MLLAIVPCTHSSCPNSMVQDHYSNTVMPGKAPLFSGFVTLYKLISLLGNGGGLPGGQSHPYTYLGKQAALICLKSQLSIPVAHCPAGGQEEVNCSWPVIS